MVISQFCDGSSFFGNHDVTTCYILGASCDEHFSHLMGTLAEQ